jgi:hypothetical protein
MGKKKLSAVQRLQQMNFRLFCQVVACGLNSILGSLMVDRGMAKICNLNRVTSGELHYLFFLLVCIAYQPSCRYFIMIM